MAQSHGTRRGWLLLLAILVAFVGLGSVRPVKATEQYAACTGRACGDCHLDPGGGGELTKVGMQFAAVVAAKPGASGKETPAPSPRLIRLVAGFVHLLTAIFWFGTILYVHLILKPAYAAKGLPRGEMRVGLVSMAVMAVTGAILMAYRVPSLAFLTTTRFGVLLLLKIALFSIMVLSALVVVFFIGPRLKRKEAVVPAAGGDMTLAQLAAFDGKEGRPAYIAYQGVVYDVTASKFWRQGAHMARHQAGMDLSAVLSQAPHGEEKVLAMPRVGRLLAAETAPAKSSVERLFYFMAYMNLGMVVAITFIVALWRWW